jgi:hypothetical protein
MDDCIESQWRLYIKYMRETLDYNITLIPLTIIPLTIFFLGQWKFAYISLGRPDYFEDSDIVATRFQVVMLNLLRRQSCIASFGLHLIFSTFLCYLEKLVWSLGAIPWTGTCRHFSKKGTHH